MADFKWLFVFLTVLSLNLIDKIQAQDSDVSGVDDGITKSKPFKVDPMCDCSDPDALYHKIIRKLIDDQGSEGKEKFLQEFRPIRVCGSDGNRYENGCELQCAKLKNLELGKQ